MPPPFLCNFLASPLGEPVNSAPHRFASEFCLAHGVARVVGALGSEAGFAGSMLN